MGDPFQKMIQSLKELTSKAAELSPELQEMFKESLKEQEGRLSNAKNAASQTSSSFNEVSSDPELFHASENAFNAPYRDSGGVVQHLMEKIEACRRSWQTCSDSAKQLYAPYIVIVQGSMMGKTRMFFMLHQHEVFVFYICLRGKGAFPSGFPELVDALTSETCSEGFYAAFILSSLEELHQFKLQTKQTDRGVTIFELWFREQKEPSFWERILGADTHIYFPPSTREITSLFHFCSCSEKKSRNGSVFVCS